MKTINSFLKSAFIIVLLLNISSCNKPAGPGGKAVVKGRIYAKDFNNTQQYLLSETYSAGEKVYICYENSNIITNDIKTSENGSFEFLYLNKGHYKVFVNSLDTSIKVKGNSTKIPITLEFDIKSTKETVDLGTITINK